MITEENITGVLTGKAKKVIFEIDFNEEEMVLIKKDGPGSSQEIRRKIGQVLATDGIKNCIIELLDEDNKKLNIKVKKTKENKEDILALLKIKHITNKGALMS